MGFPLKFMGVLDRFLGKRQCGCMKNNAVVFGQVRKHLSRYPTFAGPRTCRNNYGRNRSAFQRVTDFDKIFDG
ncbi:hypothetical protein [Roseovarius sp. A-2]|uniref:hypothetical protein n=1 Tax=Roseovarius sp. A-2 TaxID=1570360 RepID=UPI0020CADD40|nr:hypothetical protein [Roseovarius sp. A-2]